MGGAATQAADLDRDIDRVEACDADARFRSQATGPAASDEGARWRRSRRLYHLL
jgi:hypothetical protein